MILMAPLASEQARNPLERLARDIQRERVLRTPCLCAPRTVPPARSSCCSRPCVRAAPSPMWPVLAAPSRSRPRHLRISRRLRAPHRPSRLRHRRARRTCLLPLTRTEVRTRQRRPAVPSTTSRDATNRQGFRSSEATPTSASSSARSGPCHASRTARSRTNGTWISCSRRASRKVRRASRSRSRTTCGTSMCPHSWAASCGSTPRRPTCTRSITATSVSATPRAAPPPPSQPQPRSLLPVD